MVTLYIHDIVLIVFLLFMGLVLGKILMEGGGDYDFFTPLAFVIVLLVTIIGVVIYGGIYWW